MTDGIGDSVAGGPVAGDRPQVLARCFGPPAMPLFGVASLPVAAARQTAILVCPPWGAEYMRTYRGLRQLAMQLTRAGYPVLRFDYRGTGDSPGDAQHVGLADWIADIGVAAAELRERSGAPQLAVLGLRFGALLAQQAVAEGLAADALLLWDSPPGGEVYVDNLRHMDRAAGDARNRYRTPRAQLPPPGADELLGHVWPQALDAQVAALPGLRGDLRLPCQVLVSRDRTPPEGVASVRLPDASHWSDALRMYSPWIPAASFAALIAQLAESLP